MRLQLSHFITPELWDSFEVQTKIPQALNHLAIVHGKAGLVAFRKGVVLAKATNALNAINQSSFSWAFQE
jgi:hypothetical protein